MKRIAMDIMDNVTKREISAGKDPMGMASNSSVYIMS